MSLTRFARTFTTSTRVMAANEKGMLEKAGDTIKQAAQAFKVSIPVSTVRIDYEYNCGAARADVMILHSDHDFLSDVVLKA